MNLETALLLVVLGAVNHQITHVITTGVIFDEARAWVHANCGAKLGYLTTCHLCCGTWVGILMAFVLMDDVTLTPHQFINFGLLSFAIGLAGRFWNEFLAILSSQVTEIRSRVTPCPCKGV